MKARLRVLHFIANLGLLLGSLLSIELGLQVASAFSVDVDRLTSPPWRPGETATAPLLADDRLGIRGNPEWWDHDARGFRNAAALNSASVVALGDSHTYGIGVTSEESWPSVLSVLLDKDVYNMGIGGYGPTQALENFSLAIELKPELIVFGLYFGNDFPDDFLFAQRNGLLRKYADAAALAEISKLNSEETIKQKIGFLFHGSGGGEEAASVQSPSETSQSTKSQWVVRKWLSEHSRLYGLLRTLKNRVASGPGNLNALLARDFERARENLSKRQLPFVSVYDGPAWKTIFTSPYRLATLDDSDPRIRAGIEISKDTLDQMGALARGAGAKFLVLLLPTKEYVFWPRVENPDKHQSLAALVRHEDRIRNEIKEFLQARGIDVVDPVTPLRESENQPYYPDGDGHPNAIGHKLIANAVLAFIHGGNRP